VSDTFLQRAVFFGLGGAFLAAISRLTIVDLDLFHEMALIREAFSLGFLPRVDIFSYVPTITPVVHHEWGTGLILYLLTVQLGLGAPGLIILKYLLAAFIALGCFCFATRQGAGYAVFSFIALLGIAMGWGGFSTIRAQLFTLCFLIIFLFLIEADRRNKGWALWAWLPLYLIWLNLHGGFLVGVGLLAVYIGQQFFLTFLAEKNFLNSLRAVKRQIWFLLATCLLTLGNPYGIDYIPYIWNAVTLDRTPFIPEWRPLWEISWTELSEWLLSLGIVLYCATQKDLRQMSGVFIIGATAWFALWHYRHLSIYAVAWMCYTPAYLEKTPLGDLINKVWQENSRLLAAIFVIMGISGTFYAVHNQFWQIRIPTTAEEGKEGVPVYPAGAVSYLKDHKFSGNLMVPYSTGAYVSWRLYPAVKVSLDSRFEVAYPVPTVAESIRFYAAQEGWQETLAKYPTEAILIPRGSNLDRVMTQNDGGINQRASLPWTCVYLDDGFSLYLRSDLAKRFPFTDRRGQPIPARFP
jgi:hypothetical protein